MPKTTRYYLFFTLLLLLTACSSIKKETEKSAIITVTIEPLRFFTEQIVGSKFNVVSMVPKGVSPETYDPTPKQLMELNKSTAYIQIGYIGFEQAWMEKIKANTPNVRFFNASEGIQFIYGEDHHHGDHTHHGGVDPHTWNSTSNALLISKNILSFLKEIDPDNFQEYQQNYYRLVQEIKEVEKSIQLKMENRTGEAFMIYHPALSYFARDYQLTQLSIEEEGKEPTPSHLKHLIDLCKRYNIQVIFVQPEFDHKNAELIARETHTSIVSINPLSYNWKEEMLTIANALSQNHE